MITIYEKKQNTQENIWINSVMHLLFALEEVNPGETEQYYENMIEYVIQKNVEMHAFFSRQGVILNQEKKQFSH